MVRKKKSDFLVVGVTGGIGSGKSTVCRLFEAIGRPVLRADEIAKSVMQEDAAIRKKLVEAFGPSVFQHNGRLARQVLAERVFTNPANLRTLNRIVHPAVFARIGGMLEELPSERRRPYVIVEAALIYESGYDSELDYVVAVNADEAVRIRRIMKRDGCAEQAVRDRMQSQMNPEQIRKKADFVIINDGDPRALSPGVHLLHTLLSSLAAGRP